MKKRLLSLALCGALLCGALAGCGGNETPSTSQESSPSQTAEEPKILTTAVSAELNTLYPDRKSTRLNSSHNRESRMPSSA